ncbi:MAG: cytochrome oxidase putative small subunit CydP [Cycloclasticus sp.]
MRKLFSSGLSKEITLILAVKVALLIMIKVLWFSNPQQHVQQSFTQTVLGETTPIIKKESP